MNATLFAVCLWLLPVAAGCTLLQDRSPEVLFVIPDGYRGLVILDSYDAEGADATPVNNVITLLVNEDGHVSVKGALPTVEWHRLSARYAGGGQIPVPTPSASVSDDDIALRTVGLYENKQDWFVVGTSEDLKIAQEKKRGFKWPLVSYLFGYGDVDTGVTKNSRHR